MPRQVTPIDIPGLQAHGATDPCSLACFTPAGGPVAMKSLSSVTFVVAHSSAQTDPDRAGCGRESATEGGRRIQGPARAHHKEKRDAP